MPDLWLDVDTALSEVPVNIMPLISDSDFKTIDDGVVYNEAGMDLVWNFTTTGGATTQTAVTPTTSGTYDWTNQGNGMYTLEIPASGGASINNDTEGFGWFTGVCTGVLPWRGPTIGFRAAGLNNLLIDDAYSTTRGLAGTALPNAAAEAAGGLYTRGTGAGQINQAANGQVDTNTVAISGDATAADNLEAAFDGGSYNVGGGGIVAASVTGAVGSVTGAVGSVTGNVGGNVNGNVAGSVASVTNRVTANTDQLAGQTVTAAAGVTFPTSVASPTNITAGTITTVTNLTNAPTNGDFTSTMKTSLADTVWDAPIADHLDSGSTGAALNAAGSSGDPWATVLPGAYGPTTAGGIVGNNLNATVSSRATDSGVWANGTRTLTAWSFQLPSNGLANVTAWNVAITGNITGNLSGSVGSVTGLNPALLDVAVSTRLAAADYVAPDNADIAAIKDQTDQLTFTVANVVDANIRAVNDINVTGTGTGGDPWGP